MEELNLDDNADRLERILNAKSQAENVSDGESIDSEDELGYSANWSFSYRQDELEEEFDWNAKPTLENCYQINIKYQDVLEKSIRDLEFELSKNREYQFLIQEELIKSQSESKPKFSWSTFCKPYFRDRGGLAPPSNEDVKKKANNDWSLDTMPSTWSGKENLILQKAIVTNTIEKKLNPKMANCEVLAAEIKNFEGDITELQKKKNKLKMAEMELEPLKTELEQLKMELEPLKMDLESLKKIESTICTDFLLKTKRTDDYDWMKISAMDFGGRRSPVEIELYWRNYLHPSINKSKWKKEDLEALKTVIKEQALFDWDDISHKLGTGRTALQCCSKYHSKLHPIYKRFWTIDEKTKIVNLVEKYRIGDYIPWVKIADEMEGRTIKQVWQQYHYVINPIGAKGKWTEPEDMRLLAGVWLLGENVFWKVCKYVGIRTSKQCYERWNFALNPNLRLCGWTVEEDQKLLELVKQRGKSWCALKEHFEGRTGPMIMRRYNRISSPAQSRLRANYNPKPCEYQRHIYRCVYMCLKNFSRGYKMKQPNSFLAFKKSIFNPNAEDIYGSIRRVVLQLPLNSFHKMLNPCILRAKTYKSGSVEDQLKTYLSLFNRTLNVGRPTRSFKVKENVEEFEKHLSGLTKVMSVFKQSDGSQNKMILLPPMVKTLSVFRSLLLLKSHLLYLQMQVKEDEDIDENDSQLEAVTSSESYQLLFQQFACLFFWPAILSAVKLQEATIDKPTSIISNKDTQNNENAGATKRKVSKGFSTRARRRKRAKELRDQRKATSSTEQTSENPTEQISENPTEQAPENTTVSVTRSPKPKKRKIEPTFCSNQRKSSRLMKKNIILQ